MKKSLFRVTFLGTPDYVLPIKESLSQHFTLVNSLEKADLGVVASYGHILTENELNKPKLGCINVHPSLLPKYRGATPIQQAILNGDQVSGLTIIKMDEQIDHGPIIYQEEIALSSNDTFATLSKKMFQRAADILPKVIEDFTSGKLIPKPQDHSKASFCDKLERVSGYIELENPPSPEILERMIRAYYPWPGVWTKWNSKVVKFLPEGKIQMEGKKPLSLKDFLNGYPEIKEKINQLY